MKIDLIVRVDGEELIRKYETDTPGRISWDRSVNDMIDTIKKSYDRKF